MDGFSLIFLEGGDHGMTPLKGIIDSFILRAYAEYLDIVVSLVSII